MVKTLDSNLELVHENIEHSARNGKEVTGIMVKKVVYNILDICVACGKPTIPGEMLCEECKRVAKGESPVKMKPEDHMAGKRRRKIKCGLKI